MGPRRRKSHHSYDESVDEPADLIEGESVEVEEAVPAEDNEPMQTIDENNDTEPPAFSEQ
jgi:hypothetical protein